jgi:predicted Rossmann fold nucleotide-binding protein DprA/Smf involved in DNA uptake
MLAPALTKEEELHWLALRLISGLGTRKTGKLVARFHTAQSIFRASRSELEAGGLPGSIAQTIASGCTFEDAVDQPRLAAAPERKANRGAQNPRVLETHYEGDRRIT